jgi:hypothetical protein
MLPELAGRMPALHDVAYASQRASALGIPAQGGKIWITIKSKLLRKVGGPKRFERCRSRRREEADSNQQNSPNRLITSAATLFMKLL